VWLKVAVRSDIEASWLAPESDKGKEERTMKRKMLIASLVVAAVAVAASVVPVVYDSWTAGKAWDECQDAGCTASDFAYKVEPWDDGNPSGSYDADGGAVIAITAYEDENEYKTFDWSISTGYVVHCVIVKAGTGALVYEYGMDGVTGDTNVWAYQNKGVSHATFCYSKVGDCYEEETAWTDGDRYTNKGNWATYTAYDGEATTVNIVAGKNTVVGTATFSAPDANNQVTITIDLTGAIFYYDVNDPLYDDNLKVQDYDSKPSGNPAPGTFEWKTQIDVGSTTGSIVVPANNYYGVHLDVAVPCEE
jgi:hypothetical protein